MKNLRIFYAPFLQVRIRLDVLCDKCGRGDTEHVHGKFLLIHQFRSGHAHELDADAHETDVIDVRCDVRTGPGKTDPATERLRLGIDAVAKLRGKIVVNDKLPAYDDLSFGVPAALKSAGFPETSNLRCNSLDNRAQISLLFTQQLSLGIFHPLILPLFAHQCVSDARYFIAQASV